MKKLIVCLMALLLLLTGCVQKQTDYFEPGFRMMGGWWQQLLPPSPPSPSVA